MSPTEKPKTKRFAPILSKLIYKAMLPPKITK
jgi:hypothetical protein